MRVRMLGCGTSSGVPRIGNDWGECDPAEPRNRRTRVSIMVETATTRILVDTTPDLREQLLGVPDPRLDAVIWTHDHADHCNGIDDLRQVFHLRGSPVPGYARPGTAETLQRRFGYVFSGLHGYPSTVQLNGLNDDQWVGDCHVRVVDQPHGAITSAGLLFEHGGRTIGYATDFHDLTPAMAALFGSVDLWIVDALRAKPHPSHATLGQVLGWVEQLRPGRTILTHMDQSMDYARLTRSLPHGVEPGYDGLEVQLA